MRTSKTIDAKIQHDRDLENFDYFAVKTLERSYLIRDEGRIIERPQVMYMREAIGIHYFGNCDDLDDVDVAPLTSTEVRALVNTLATREERGEHLLKHRGDIAEELAFVMPEGDAVHLSRQMVAWLTGEIRTAVDAKDEGRERALVEFRALFVSEVRVRCLPKATREAILGDILESYEELSNKFMTHATPTMFNAGTKVPTLASCFLLTTRADSIPGIFQTLEQCALISKSAGGVGLSVTNVRASGSRISSTGGQSTGLVPMLRVFDAAARYVDQGGGKRKGGFAIYLEPWHADIKAFLDLKKNHGADELRARDLFYGLWIPDLFMKRVEAKGQWSLFCPSKCPDLVDLYGDAFEARYLEYEATEGLASATLPAQELWFAILDAQVETGTPYLLYKDACNRKSNQKNLGTIRCSNLCTEVVQYSSDREVAVCNLASLSLPAFVVGEGAEAYFDHKRFAQTVRVAVRNLNKVIDRNAYPLPETRRSNFRHRPIGLGVQGLADVYVLMDLPFASEGASTLNFEIFESLYYVALETSCDLAEAHGPYETFWGSPASEGKLQFDLWGDDVAKTVMAGTRWDWAALKARIVKTGLRNSSSWPRCPRRRRRRSSATTSASSPSRPTSTCAGCSRASLPS